MKKILLLTSLLIAELVVDAQQWIRLNDGITYTGGKVLSMAIDSANNYLYVSGSFGEVDHQASGNIARWDGNVWNTLGITNGGTAECRSIITSGSIVYMANTNGNANVVKYDGIETALGYANADIEDLCWWNGKLVAVGEFASIDGVTCNGIAVYDTTTQQWSSLGQGVTFGSDVKCCYNWNGNLVIGGLFESINNHTCHNIAMYNGSQWQAIGNGIGDLSTIADVKAIQEYNGQLYACGLFETPLEDLQVFQNGQFQGIGWSSSNGDLLCMHVFNGKLYLGGGCVYTYDGTAFQVVTNGDYPSGYTYALTDYNNEIIAGGGFKHASNGDTLNCIARYDENIAAPVMQVNNISYGPNPTTNQIHLNYLPANAIIQIQNINGQTLIQTNTQNNSATVDVSSLPSGIYLLEIQSEQGITVKKFVKQ